MGVPGIFVVFAAFGFFGPRGVFLTVWALRVAWRAFHLRPNLMIVEFCCCVCANFPLLSEQIRGGFSPDVLSSCRCLPVWISRDSSVGPELRRFMGADRGVATSFRFSPAVPNPARKSPTAFKWGLRSRMRFRRFGYAGVTWGVLSGRSP